MRMGLCMCVHVRLLMLSLFNNIIVYYILSYLQCIIVQYTFC